MTKRDADISEGHRWAVIALAFTSVGCANLSGQAVPRESFSGVLQIAFPGHSVFETMSGEFYSLRIDNDEASSLLARQIREGNNREELCLELGFEGELLEEEDFVGRSIVSMKTLNHVRTVSCP